MLGFDGENPWVELGSPETVLGFDGENPWVELGSPETEVADSTIYRLSVECFT